MARKLSTKESVTPPGGDYPYGRIKDDTGSQDGTPVNEEVYGDIHQFFERLMDEAEVAFNNFPDNSYSGFQYFTALTNYIKGVIDNYPQLRSKVVEIGSWNMDTAATVAVTHGISDYRKIRSISGVLRDDGDTILAPIPYVSDVVADILSVSGVSSTTITLRRVTGGQFDNTSYDDTTISRGKLVIHYTL